MSFKRMKFFWIAAAFSGLLFALLFSKQYVFIYNGVPTQHFSSSFSSSYVPDRNTWKNIFQNGQKIGVSHSTFSKIETGYRLHETLYLRINTMGMIQDISLDTNGKLNPDFSLSSFSFEISSGRFRFTATGFVSNDTLTITTRSAGAAREQKIQLKKKIYLTAGIIDAVMASDLSPSEVLAVEVFDPATMSQQPVDIRLIGKEDIMIMGQVRTARKISLNFKGLTQTAWVGESGEILKEQGLLGISLEKTSRDDALFGLPLESSDDLTKVASVPSNVVIKSPDRLDLLRARISGISLDNIHLDGGRQTFKDGILTVRREIVSDTSSPRFKENPQTVDAEYLKPSTFIQSDHPKIKNQVAKIIDPSDTPHNKAVKLIAWIDENIEKKPVLSLPDALSTLENRVGDCNEHAMLLSAFARAAGIPSRIEAGLVYLNGRFYYHAWNTLYTGRWITADSLFGQMPADVTHLRFTTGTHKLQLDIMSIIGKVGIHILHPQADPVSGFNTIAKESK